MIVLSLSADTPIVPIGQVHLMDEGQLVAVVGLLADLKVHDSGAESLLLVDPEFGSTVKVVCLQGVRPRPSALARIGDELKVLGRVSHSNYSTVLFSNSDDVSIVRPSELVLSLELLASNWRFFEGDPVRVVGVLVEDGPASLRLFDHDLEHSIRVASRDDAISQLAGRTVLVQGVLVFDSASFSLLLDAEQVLPWSR